MTGKHVMITSVSLLFLQAAQAMAATSKMNNHFRIFEDTLWCVTFTLMVIAGLSMKRFSSRQGKVGYMMLALTGLSGWLWKSIGLVKRIFMIKEPVWFFDIVRETLEGMTGLLLALACVVLVISMKHVYNQRMSLAETQPSPTNTPEPAAFSQ